jgi:DNA-binding MarR family transcriptional regulator
MTVMTYPQAGTNAEAILEHIRGNPGVSRNAIITALELNPSVVKKTIKALMDHDLVTDSPDERGFHRYTAARVEVSA